METITFKAPDGTRAEYAECAAAEGRNLSEWIRTACAVRVSRQRPPVEAADTADDTGDEQATGVPVSSAAGALTGGTRASEPSPPAEAPAARPAKRVPARARVRVDERHSVTTFRGPDPKPGQRGDYGGRR